VPGLVPDFEYAREQGGARKTDAIYRDVEVWVVLPADWDEEVGMCGEPEFELDVKYFGGRGIDFFSFILCCTMRY
jgi:hypothetical protein